MRARDAEIERQIPALRRYARALTGAADTADDLVQEAVTRALTRWHLFVPGRKLRPWLFTILHNCFVSAARADARRPHLPLDEASASVAPSDPVAAEAIRRALAELPDEQRAVLLLVALEGFSYREAAAILAVPVGTVMSRLSRARSALRLSLDEDRLALRRVK